MALGISPGSDFSPFPFVFFFEARPVFGLDGSPSVSHLDFNALELVVVAATIT
jgi:hypothetical protein